MPLADDGCERLLGPPRDQQHGGQERRREQGRDGRRRLGVRIGEPVVHRRPADLRRQARDQQQVGDERRSRFRRRRSGAPARRAPTDRLAGMPAARMTIPSSATPSPSEVRTRYFQPASSARALAAEADEQRGGGGGRLDEQPGDAEVPGQRHREQDRPEGVEQRVVHAAGGARARRASAPPPARYAGETSTLARPTTPITPTRSPPATSMASHVARDGIAAARDTRQRRSARPRAPPSAVPRATSSAGTSRAGTTASSTRRERGHGNAAAAISSRLVTQRPQHGAVAGVPNSAKIRS